MMNNQDRAERANAALNAYCAHVGDQRSAFGERELLGDMLGDLMHYAQSVGVPFDEVMKTGEMTFITECDEEADDRAGCERCGTLDHLEDVDGEDLCTDCQHAAQDGSLYGEDA
ncbi:hypothetical protein [Oceanicaulis sp. MMSF_3324]|uniref:hypothetical protein n=1 Tax=Oceanicaulis sp. MMSF_3324 TaxID=3046702 RepID=UPI00273D716F|nr:hypothetical protein [Oceanicaulis sp. MMSF_3324]